MTGRAEIEYTLSRIIGELENLQRRAASLEGEDARLVYLWLFQVVSVLITIGASVDRLEGKFKKGGGSVLNRAQVQNTALRSVDWPTKN